MTPPTPLRLPEALSWNLLPSEVRYQPPLFPFPFSYFSSSELSSAMAVPTRTPARAIAAGAAEGGTPVRDKGKGVAGRVGKPPKAPVGAKTKPVPRPKVKAAPEPSPVDDEFPTAVSTLPVLGVDMMCQRLGIRLTDPVSADTDDWPSSAPMVQVLRGVRVPVLSPPLAPDVFLVRCLPAQTRRLLHVVVRRSHRPSLRGLPEGCWTLHRLWGASP